MSAGDHGELTGRKEKPAVRASEADSGIQRKIESLEMSLRHSNETALTDIPYKLLFENSMDAVLLIGADDDAIFAANPAACELLGCSEQDLVAGGKGWSCGHLDPKICAFLKERDKYGRSRAEFVIKRADGTKVSVEATTAAFVDKDGVRKASLILRDIGARTNLERERADFCAMVTHDLKSPLTAILGYTDLLLTEYMNCSELERQKMVASIQQCTLKLFGLAEDFLTISRIESGNMKLKVGPEVVSRLVLEVLDDYTPRITKKGLKLVIDVQEEMPRTLVDARHMERAVANLLANAVNYTPKGGTVTVCARQTSGGKDIEVSVEDTGHGIAHEEQEKVFEKYYRSPKVAGVKGSGLGLAIVKAIAEAHGGSVGLVSEPGAGSKFTMRVPVSLTWPANDTA
jgi:PAS domain S-box-containing protein